MDSVPPTLSPTVLTIAGSDPSGGAGIQADLKTMTAIGVYGAAAITCITVQNSMGVTESLPLDGGLVARQVQAVLSDHHVTHIKIGMIGTMEIAGALGRLLEDYQGEVIYDPVLASTSGQSLLSCSSLAELSHHLISRVTVLTPNCDELEQLVRQEITTPAAAISCAGSILARHGHLQAVIVKGGHLQPERSDIHDYLVLKNHEVLTSKRPRIRSANLHGTGCTFASAFTAFHCRENDYGKAFYRAVDYMDRIISTSASVSLVKSGVNGPLFHAG